MKNYESPQVEITPIYNSDVFTASSGDGPIEFPEEKFD